MRRASRSPKPNTFLPTDRSVFRLSVTVSIVSHGHGTQVGELLAQLAELRNAGLRRVILTVNVPEADSPDTPRCGDADWPFELRRIDNRTAAGFGANHNRAFAEDERLGASDCFAVVNPDVRLIGDPLPALLEALASEPATGCAYPCQLDARGRPHDHERLLPSPLALARRYLGLERRLPRDAAPDWVNAAFLLFRREVFARLGGFDTRYHMYCEDVDLCLRLKLAGRTLVPAPQACVVHEGRRATRRSGRHLGWHLASLWRLWNSAPYRDFKRLRQSAL